MSALSNLKRHLLSTVMPVPLRGDIIDFPSTLAGHIIAYGKMPPPASVQAYLRWELAKWVEREIEFMRSHQGDNEEARARRMRLSSFINNQALPVLERWELATKKGDSQSAAEMIADHDVDPNDLYSDRGYSHRVEAWVHPVAGGDDYRITFYGRGDANHDTIQAFIGRQGSAVLTDYSVVTL